MFDSFIAEGGSDRRRLSTYVYSQAMAPPRSELIVERLVDEYYTPREDQLAERMAERKLQRLNLKGGAAELNA
jgi:hypothetical protein